MTWKRSSRAIHRVVFRFGSAPRARPTWKGVSTGRAAIATGRPATGARLKQPARSRPAVGAQLVEHEPALAERDSFLALVGTRNAAQAEHA